MEVQKPSGFWEIMLQIKGTAFEQLCSKNNKFRMERNKKVIKDWMSRRNEVKCRPVSLGHKYSILLLL